MVRCQRPLFLQQNDLEQSTRTSEETARTNPGNLVQKIIQQFEARCTASPNNTTQHNRNEKVEHICGQIYRCKTSEPPGSSQSVQWIPEEGRPHIPERQLLQGQASRDTLMVSGNALRSATEKQPEMYEQSFLKTIGYYRDGNERSVSLFYKEAAKHEVTKTNKMTVKLPKDLISFIKSSGVILRYQTDFKKFKHPVFLELGSDMVLSSESSYALHEALAAVQEDLSVETIKLQGAAAFPPELDRVRQTLMNANNEADPDGLRANVRFFPGLEGNTVTKVRLVGFSDAVNTLKNILQDDLVNNLATQETLNLPHPELVDHFERFMGLIGMMETQVTLKTSHLQGPCVILSGPGYKVQEVKRVLVSALARVISDTLVLDGPGARRYFQTDGNMSKGLIENSCKVIITARTDVLQPTAVSLAANSSQTTYSGQQHKLSASSVLQRFHNLHGPRNLRKNQGNQAVSSSDAADLKGVSVNLKHGVTLQLVFGDITKEKADAVVNSTNFKDFRGGVCNAILSVAGRHLETSLRQAKVKKGAVFITPPGSFPCKSIFHVHGRGKTRIIEQLVHDVIQQCESLQYKSVAIPAICAGAARLDSQTVAGTILQAIKNATSSTSLHHLSRIRIVLNEFRVLWSFCLQLDRTFPCDVFKRESFLQRGDVQGKQPLHLIPRLLSTTPPGEQSVFFFLGVCRKDIDDAKTKVNDHYQAHCSIKTFPKEDLKDLTEADVKVLQELLKTEALHVQEDMPGGGGLKVSGLKVGVEKVAQMICSTTPLRRELKIKEEEERFALVTWCILGHDGTWGSLPKSAVHDLEKENVAEGIVDKQGTRWRVNLQRMEAKSGAQTRKLKRLENRKDFTLPLDWDSMNPEENLKVVPLQAESTEYRTVESSFRRTAANIVTKIERVQNVHLRRVYEVQKQRISEKNSGHGAGEKLLYHGTKQETCGSIKINGFNRSFSGENGASLGHGTYFAVNANYSVNYATPGADGSRTMFLARVLTGSFTQGQNNMRFPPPRSRSDPHDCYDTVVDRTNQPDMYVVFNDNQAYPEYLITFY